MRRIFYSFIILIAFISIANSQCPAPAFDVSSFICTNANLSLSNNSLNSTAYSWDFCSGDLEGLPTNTALSTSVGITNPGQITLKQDGNNWYGFSIDQTLNTLSRLNFGSSVSNTPTVTGLGNVGGLLTGSKQVEFIKDGSDWYGLAVTSGNKLIRINFGNSLGNVPTATNIPITLLSNPFDLDVVYDGSKYVAVIANYGNNRLVLVNFGSTLATIPPTTNMLRSSISPGSTTGLSGIRVVQECSGWYGIGVANTIGKLYIYYFGANLYSVPFAIGYINGIGTLSNPLNIEIGRDGGKYYGFLLSSSSLYKINLGKELPGDSFSSENLGDIGIAGNKGGWDLVKEGSKWYGFTFDRSGAVLNRINFPDSCSADTTTSIVSSPTTISYTKSGTYQVTLTGYNNGVEKSLLDTIKVVDPTIPDFTVPTGIVCSNQAQTITNTSTGNTEMGLPWLWEYYKDLDIKIGETTAKDGSFSFPAVGTYSIKLTAGYTGCQNSITKSITVNTQAPSANFAVSNFCLGAPTVFTNSSSGDGITSYNWDFGDGSPSSTLENPIHTYVSAGSYIVKLTVLNSSGCGDVIKEDTVRLFEVPQPDIRHTEAFAGESMGFSVPSLVTGDVISGYTWDFGDPSSSTNNSTDPSPTHTYEKGGKYLVKLNITTEAGCSVSVNRTVQVFENTASECPVPDFDIPSLMCTTSDLSVSNTSKDALRFKWDFCAGDLEGLPKLNAPATAVGITNPNQITIKQDGNNWYGFSIDQTANTLSRLNFGSSLSNIPTVASLGNVGGLLAGAKQVDFIKDGSNWYGLVVTSGNKLVRINFGNSLSNVPTATNIPITLLNNPYDLDIVFDGSKYVAVIANYGNNRIVVVNFGSSLANIPPTTNMVHSAISPGTTNGLSGIKIVRECSAWYGIGVSSTLGKLYLYYFGANLHSPPFAIGFVDGLAPLTNPLNIEIGTDGGKYYGFVLSSSSLYKINLGTEIGSSGSTSSDLGDIGIAGNKGGWDLVKEGSKWYGFTFEKSTGNLNRIDFPDTCSANISISSESSPSVRYSQPGNYKISLTGYDNNGNEKSIQKTIKIVEPTIPDFTVPVGIVCTNQEQTFFNTSTGNLEEGLPWKWEYFDSNNIKLGESSSKEGAFNFSELGNYTIKLTAGYDACPETKSKVFTVTTVGPKTNFSFQNICLGQATLFTDNTIGDGLTEWHWDFGDGNSSTVRNPNNFYNGPGAYNVTLKVKNTNGCEVSKTTLVTIYNNPVADFTYGLLCNGDPIEFVDNSTLSDGNIVGWTWQVYDEQQNLIEEKSGSNRESFLLSNAGNYTVSLITTSERGCSTMATKEIEVIPSPIIDIELSELCAGDSVVLDGISKVEGQEVVAWKWSVNQGEFLDGQTVKYKFPTAGIYNISLLATSPNGCETLISKDYQIYLKPAVDFTITNNCLNSPAQFVDSTKVEGDVISSWSWNFGGLGTSDLQNPEFTFNKEDSVWITLTTTTSKGCTSSKSQRIKIHGLPTANFTFTPEVGPPPFEVKFTNNSLGATNFNWSFGNGDTSTESEPVYTFNELGVYTVDLISTNEFGCSDTISKNIRVMPPALTIELQNLVVSTLTEEVAFAVEVKNTGSKIVRDIEFVADFGGKLSFKENWAGTLNPEEKFTYTFKTHLLKDQLPKVLYICTYGHEINNEVNTVSNTVCFDLAENFVVFDFIPNPARGEVAFTYLLPEKKVFEINFYNSVGQKVSLRSANSEKGFNQSKLNLSDIKPGMYLVEFIFGNQRVKKRLMVY